MGHLLPLCVLWGKGDGHRGVLHYLHYLHIAFIFSRPPLFSLSAHPTSCSPYYYVNCATDSIVHRRFDSPPCSFSCLSLLWPLPLCFFHRVSKMASLDQSLYLMYQLVAIIEVVPMSSVILTILIWVSSFRISF